MRIEKEKTAAVVIDMQEKLFPVIAEYEQLLARMRILLQGLRTLKIPVTLTEQYPRGLGETISSVKELVPEIRPVEKVEFSCYDCPDISSWLKEQERETVLVAGIEAHVCILQTVLDLLEAGYQPIVVEDCISSRRKAEKNVAVERMRQEGARVTTAESILFEMLRKAGTDEFKEISRLVK